MVLRGYQGLWRRVVVGEKLCVDIIAQGDNSYPEVSINCLSSRDRLHLKRETSPESHRPQYKEKIVFFCITGRLSQLAQIRFKELVKRFNNRRNIIETASS